MKPLKTSWWGVAIWCLSRLLAEAGASQTKSFEDLNQVIPDANASGLSYVRVISSSITRLSSVRVQLQIHGEFNGDLYAYLRHVTPDTTNFCVLLNRPGKTVSNPFGYDDFGLDILFDDSSVNGDIHTYRQMTTPEPGSPLMGLWQPDGRKIDPFSVSDETPRTTALNLFAGQPAGGEWTLFLADLQSGGTNFLLRWALEFSGMVRPEVSWPTPADILYGAALEATQLNASSAVPGVFTYDPPPGTVLNAGSSQVLTVTFTPEDTDNYQVVTTNVHLNVLRAPLTIRAMDVTNVHGAPLPTFTASYTGLVNGDTPASLDSPLALTTSATSISDVGAFAIIASDAMDANYSIEFVPGMLTIIPAPTTATLASSGNPARPGELLSFTFGARTLAPSTALPIGDVIFKIDGLSTSVPLANGLAILSTSLSVGAHVVEAEYVGAPNFIGCTNRLSPDQMINTPPVAGTDEIPRYLPYGAKVPIATLLRNDSDADLHPLSFVSVETRSANTGLVARTGNWISYTPPPGFTNDDAFHYTISDGLGQPAVGTVIVRVQVDALPSPTLAVMARGDGSYHISFRCVPNATFEIEFTDGLDPANWQSLGIHTADQNGVFEILDTPAPGFGQRFYRSVYP
jgi:subtilisin-like proprotein convertase family protein